MNGENVKVEKDEKARRKDGGATIVKRRLRVSSRGPGPSGADIAHIKLSYSILPPTVGSNAATITLKRAKP
ncbi:hypothetical protein PV327_001550 [Microctonus hyperodae]|uniref:Uncharacterized protein n=1 Tax=Microctonus hyperodae TaxID=165561 RepID=A0AA39G8W8_MICHY|nr:hypothetical protein PV327_001550 [Microctonus hyperodae]